MEDRKIKKLAAKHDGHSVAIFFACVVLALACFFSTAAFAETTVEEVATSPETFAVCKAADVVSTIYLLEHGWAIEANPIVAWSMQVGGYMPLVLVSAGLYWVIKHFKDEPGMHVATGIANVTTCGVAVHNLLLIP